MWYKSIFIWDIVLNYILHVIVCWYLSFVLNQEAVKIVSTAPHKEKAGERLVKYAAMREWKRKRSGIPMDDMSVICLFFNQLPATKIVD
jgi:hypothetical protein